MSTYRYNEPQPPPGLHCLLACLLVGAATAVVGAVVAVLFWAVT